MSLFLRLTAFAGMFFASAVVPIDGGAADVGDTGGDSGAADTGTSEAVEEPIEGEETEAVSDDSDGVDDAGDVSGDTGSGQDADGRKAPDAIKKALNKMRESDPEAAGILRKAFFTQEQQLRNFTSAFKTPVEAVAARDLIESSGGEEGIQSAFSDAKTFASEINQMAQGDPSLIDTLAKESPDGLVKLAPVAVDRMREINPEAYERFSGRIVAQTLADKGVMGALDRVLELISDGKQQLAFDKANAIRQWMHGVKEFSAAKPKDAKDPREQDIQRRESEVRTKEQRAFERQVQGAVVTRMNTMIESNLKPYINDAVKSKRGLTVDQKKGLASGIYTRISSILGADQGYKDRLREMMNEGNSEKVARFVENKVSQLVGKATRSEWHSRGFAGTNGTKAKAVVKQAGPGGVISKPTPDKIDWSKDRNRMRYTGDGEFGEATLKDGRVIKFKH